MSEIALAPAATNASANDFALIPKPTKVPLKALPPSAFQHPLESSGHGKS